MNEITQIKAREVLDSRGCPTVEVDVHVGDVMAREMVPSGASKGSHEALELRDGGKRFHGLGVQKAVRNVNEFIAPKLIGMDVTEQRKIDHMMIELDGTENKSNLGANAIMGVSITCARASALVQERNFFEHFADMVDNKDYIIPTPFMNIINGGEHADNNLDFQEYMIVPCGNTFKESLCIAAEVYHELRSLIKERYGPFQVNIGDEGGFCPNLEKYYEPLDLIMDVIDRLGYDGKVKLAVDAAANYFYEHGKYEFYNERRDKDEMMEIYEELIEDYPLVSIEDPFHEDDFEAFAELTAKFKDERVNIVGDDLLCTNEERIRKAIDMDSCTNLLLKVNQIGTVSEAVDAALLALENDWDVMVSHRSGETEDHFIADFAVGLSTGQIKAGAPSRGERTAKYNQLLRLEEKLGENCRYPGSSCIRSCNLPYDE